MMNVEEIRNYCLQKNGAEESFPFDGETLVFKVGGKVFLLCDLNEGDRINVKCDPDWAVDLRERYTEIIPGFHMNKKHWNTVFINGSLSISLILEIIDHSYNLVFNHLPKALQQKILSEIIMETSNFNPDLAD